MSSPDRVRIETFGSLILHLPPWAFAGQVFHVFRAGQQILPKGSTATEGYLGSAHLGGADVAKPLFNRTHLLYTTGSMTLGINLTH